MKEKKYSEEEKAQFNYERFNHPHPRVQIKMEFLWLKSKGLSNSYIAFLTELCENTVIKYIKEYEEGGLKKLKEINFYRPKSELEQHGESLEKYLQN